MNKKKLKLWKVSVIVFVVAFFLNPWALSSQVTNVTRRVNTTSFYYYFYGMVPAILNNHPDVYPPYPSNEYVQCRENIDVMTIGSMVISYCTKLNYSTKVDWAFYTVDPSQFVQIIKSIWDGSWVVRSFKEFNFDLCVKKFGCRTKLDENITRLTHYRFNTNQTTGPKPAKCISLQYTRQGEDVYVSCVGTNDWRDFSAYYMFPNAPVAPLPAP